MASTGFWDDPLFASVQHDRADPPPDPYVCAPKQSVGKIGLNDTQSILTGKEAPKFSGWDGFFSDPVFAKVTGRHEKLPPGQQREFWKYEVDGSVSVASLFPSLSSSAFGAVSFKQSAIEFWSKSIGNEPAGLYFRTEVEFNGLLDDVFRTFKEFLGEAAKPSLRLSAYLGLTPMPDQTFILDGLTLSGSLLGLQIPLPPFLELVTILSVGVKLNVGRKSHLPITGVPTTQPRALVDFEIFGGLHVELPGLTGPLRLDYKATIDDEFLRLIAVIPGNKKWSNALGAESLHLDNVQFTANIPLSSSSKKQRSGQSGTLQRREGASDQQSDPRSVISLSVRAKWQGSGGKGIDLEGELFKGRPDLSYLQGTMLHITWSDIKQLFSDIHGEAIEDTDHNITCEKLIVRLSQAQFFLTGALTIDGRPLAEATIAISKAGIAITAKAQDWDVADGFVTVKNASLTLLIGKPSSIEQVTPRSNEEPPAKRQKTEPAPATKTPGWSGCLEVSGRVVINEDAAASGRKPIDIGVTFVAGKQGKEFFWVLCGHMESDISLSQFISAIDENSDIDFRLKSVSLIASNANNPACSVKTNGYTVRKGFFICAKLEQVPLVKVGKTVKRPAAGDETHMSIGWEKGSSFPSVSIFLPESLKIELGPRFRSKKFQLQLSHSKTAGVSFSFSGGFKVRVDEHHDWLEFVLKMGVDAVGADGELFFEGKINDPFGLSKNLTIGPRLGIGLKFNWAQMATTGMPIGAGFEGGFYFEDDKEHPYAMALYVCEDPRDMLIKVTAPSMNYHRLIEFLAAAMDRQIPKSDTGIFSFRDVLIYASMGATFGGEHYPAGFRWKGIITVCDHEAGMDCSLTTEGFQLKAWLQTFQLGPLKVGGDVQVPGKIGTFALLEMDLSWEKQAFRLDGFVELFSLRAAIDIHVEIMPELAFYFNTELKWSDLLKVKAKAEMIKLGNMSNPKAADWVVSAEFEQSIIQEISKSLQTALEAVHRAAQESLDSAKSAVSEAEKKYKAVIEDAQKSLDANRAALKKENDKLERDMDELERRSAERKAELQAEINQAKAKETRDVQNAKIVREQGLNEKQAEVRNKENVVREKENSSQNEINNAVSDREQKKQAFMSRFGDAEDAVEKARTEVRLAKGSVDEKSQQIKRLEDRKRGFNFFQKALMLDVHFQIAASSLQLGTAKIGLGIAESALTLILSILHSSLFQDVKDAWYRASEAVDTVKGMIELAIKEARDQLSNAKKLLEAAALTLEGNFEEAERKAKEMVTEAQKRHDVYRVQQDLKAEKLSLQLSALKNSVLSTAVTTADGALELAKNNNVAFKAAQAGLDAVKVLEGTVYQTLSALIEAAATLCDIRVVKLNGTIKANTKDQKAFTIHLEGTLVGQDFNLDVDYTPGQTTDFLERLAKRAFEHLRIA